MNNVRNYIFACALIIAVGAIMAYGHAVEMIPCQPKWTLGNEHSTFEAGEGGFPMVTALPDSGVPSLIDSLVDYGGQASCPVNYPNARHIVHNSVVGWPAVGYEYGGSRDNDVVFCKWNEFGFWEPPQTVSDQTFDAGRVGYAVDSEGNVHAIWHQTDDGNRYYTRYARLLAGGNEWTDFATLNYNLDLDGIFPSITVDYDDNVWGVYLEGAAGNEVWVNQSLDGGASWEGAVKIPGGPYEQGWSLAALDAGSDGTVHCQFMGGGRCGGRVLFLQGSRHR